MADAIAHVYKQGVFAATLTRTGSEVTFQYLPDYLEAAGEPVATTLPLSAQPVVNTNGASPAFFANLLPEGRRAGAIASRLKVSVDDDIALLLEIGSDLIGDVQVISPNTKANSEREVLHLPGDTSELNFSEIRDSYFDSKAAGLPGYQDKVSSKMLNAPARTANRDFIVKFNPTDVPLAVENEAFFLSLAKKCGITTSKFELLTDKVGNHALRLWRFDRIAHPSKTFKLAMEDGCQVLNLYPSQKYKLEFLEVATALIDKCDARGFAGFELYKQLVFMWLTANGDAHAKNFSVLKNMEGEWRVSPAYDLMCTAFYNNDRTMALGLFGLESEWDKGMLLEAAKHLRVPKSVGEKVIASQLDVLDGLSQSIVDKVLPFERHECNKVAAALKQRAKRLR